MMIHLSHLIVCVCPIYHEFPVGQTDRLLRSKPHDYIYSVFLLRNTIFLKSQQQ